MLTASFRAGMTTLTRKRVLGLQRFRRRQLARDACEEQEEDQDCDPGDREQKDGHAAGGGGRWPKVVCATVRGKSTSLKNSS